jgi:hypothetical protein
MRTIALPALVLLLTQALALHAQEACKEVLKLPAVGKWVEYQAVYDQKDKYDLRYAVVGEEKRAGTDYRWLEMRMTNQADPGKNLVYQMLVPGSLAAIGDVQEVVMKAGDQPAMKMNGMMLGMIRGQLQQKSVFGDICDEVTLVGQEKIRVPAGTFKAKHYHSAKYENDSWVDPGLSFGMVKAIGKHHDIERVRDGDGARSSITETPQEMPGMGEQEKKEKP